MNEDGDSEDYDVGTNQVHCGYCNKTLPRHYCNEVKGVHRDQYNYIVHDPDICKLSNEQRHLLRNPVDTMVRHRIPEKWVTENHDRNIDPSTEPSMEPSTERLTGTIRFDTVQQKCFIENTNGDLLPTTPIFDFIHGFISSEQLLTHAREYYTPTNVEWLEQQLKLFTTQSESIQLEFTDACTTHFGSW